MQLEAADQALPEGSTVVRSRIRQAQSTARASLAEARWLHLGAARAWLGPILAEAPIECSIVGDVDAALAVEEANRWLGSLERRPPVPVTTDLSAPGPDSAARPLGASGVAELGRAYLLRCTLQSIDQLS